MQFDLQSSQEVYSLYIAQKFDNFDATVSVYVGDVDGSISDNQLCKANVSVEGFIPCASLLSGRYIILNVVVSNTVKLGMQKIFAFSK